MSRQLDRGQRFSVPHVMLGAFLILWLTVGLGSSLASSTPGTVKMAALGAWFVMAAVRSRSFVWSLWSVAWPLMTLLLVALLYRVEVVGADQYVQGFGYLLIATSMWCFYSGSAFRKERHLLVLVMGLDLVVTGVRTLIALQTDPQVARYLATTEENRSAVYGEQSFAGLGGFGYAYLLPAVLIVLLYYLPRRHRYRALVATAASLALFVQFEMAFTTAIVLAVGLGFGFLLVDTVAKAESRLLWFALIFAGWLSGLYTWVLDVLVRQDWVSDDVQQRLAELADFLSGRLVDRSDLGTRLDLWGDSTSSFLDGGLLGSASGNSGGTVGGHSQWLDLLAAYGVMALLLAIFFARAWGSVKRQPWLDIKPVGRAWVYFLLVGVVNPLLFSTVVLGWMFFVPSLASQLGNRSLEQGETVEPERSKL